ncbi:MAG: MBL fold metallo-hydrolase [Geminicoccaceae bacterium]
MKPLKPPLRYLAERAKNGVPVPLADDIYWVRAALPFALDHVNIWLLRDAEGWTVIDCGYADDWTCSMWDGLLSGLLAGHPVRSVVATHFHPDHAGLAGWLVERTGAELVMSRSEWLTTRMLKLDDTEDFNEAGVIYDRQAGLDEEMVEKRRQRGNRYRLGVSLATSRYRRLRHGDTLPMAGSSWKVIVGEGHAPEMLTFHSAERGMLITADQILPRITPIVGVWPSAAEDDPLGDFLACIDNYRDIDPDIAVLPSHDGPFHGLHPRLDQLAAHHEERCETTLRACREPATARAVMGALFRREVDMHQLGFAVAETLAHLNYLCRNGRVRRHREEGQADLYESA